MKKLFSFIVGMAAAVMLVPLLYWMDEYFRPPRRKARRIY